MAVLRVKVGYLEVGFWFIYAAARPAHRQQLQVTGFEVDHRGRKYDPIRISTWESHWGLYDAVIQHIAKVRCKH